MKTMMLVLVMVAGCGKEPAPFVAVPPPQPSPAPAPAPKPPTMEEIALAFAKQKLEVSLIAPATAQYPTDRIISREAAQFINADGFAANRWIVAGAVDAQNSYGALIRGTWSVTCLESADGFKPVEVTLNREVVFVDRDYGHDLKQLSDRAEAAAKAARLKENEAKLAEHEARLKVIPSLIREHEEALAKKFPKKPVGGPEYGEWEIHKNAISNLLFEAERTRAKINELRIAVAAASSGL